MCWTPRHDEILIREILLFEPWLQKKGTPERGAVWNQMAESLNQVLSPKFNVDQRSVRDHYKILEKMFPKKKNLEEKATGISPDKETDFEKGISDAICQFKDNDLLHSQKKVKRDEIVNKEREAAEEFRKASLETFGETKKRSDSDEGPLKKKRKSETETLTYLRQKNESNLALQKEELALKKIEADRRQQQEERLNHIILNQQQQTNAILQQQQQMSAALIQLLNRYPPNHNI